MKSTETNKIIIAGFPGIGKSETFKIIPEVVADCESSDFHWITGVDDGKKLCNPDWPKNYIQYIKLLTYETDGLKRYKDLLYICISTHSEVLQYLRNNHIPFIIVVPEDKDETIKRYYARGNSEEFIIKLEENWDEWMKNFESYGMPIIKLPTDMYLSDLLDRISSYKYLKAKVNDINKRILSVDSDPNIPYADGEG